MQTCIKLGEAKSNSRIIYSFKGHGIPNSCGIEKIMEATALLTQTIKDTPFPTDDNGAYVAAAAFVVSVVVVIVVVLVVVIFVGF